MNRPAGSAQGLPPAQGSGNWPQRRRPYVTSDITFVRAHYPDHTAAEVARRLGRSTGSIRNLIHRFPELRKYGRP